MHKNTCSNKTAVKTTALNLRPPACESIAIRTTPPPLFCRGSNPAADKSNLHSRPSLKLIHLFLEPQQVLGDAIPPSTRKGQIRDSAHAVDIYLAVHTKILLKLGTGTCWRCAVGVGHFQIRH